MSVLIISMTTSTWTTYLAMLRQSKSFSNGSPENVAESVMMIHDCRGICALLRMASRTSDMLICQTICGRPSRNLAKWVMQKVVKRSRKVEVSCCHFSAPTASTTHAMLMIVKSAVTYAEWIRAPSLPLSQSQRRLSTNRVSVPPTLDCQQ